MKQTRRTYLEVMLTVGAVWLIGALLLFAVCLMSGKTGRILLSGSEWKLLSGWTIGCGCAAVFFTNMKSNLETAMELDEKSARSKVTGGYIVRYAGVLLMAAACYFFHLGNVVAFVCGLFSLKAAAYLQPLAHKIGKRFGREEENS